ncbi:MAG TPA: AAA family ATPase [Ktedonobacterales bacterium]|nr:AAA family ATPase [Ktedonobacterales bacterium]
MATYEYEAPQNEEAERNILGGVFSDGGAHIDLANGLQPDDFYGENRRLIWQAVLALHAQGVPTDMITVGDELMRQGHVGEGKPFESLGGVSAEARSDEMASPLRIGHYARIVRDNARRRRAYTNFQKLIPYALRGELDELQAGYATMAEAMATENASADAALSPDRLMSDVDAEAMPPAQWMIAGLMAEDVIGVLYGPSNTYKSFLACDLGLSIASDTPFHGHAINKPGPVVYVAGEGARGVGKRIRAWKIAHGISGSVPFYVRGTPVNLFDSASVQMFAAQVAALDEPPVLIIFDTLAANSAGADENSAKDVGMIAANMNTIRRATGAAVWAVHHTGKEEARGARGSTALMSNFDGQIVCAPDGPEDAPTGVRVRCKKMKDEENFAPMAFAWRKVYLDETAHTSSLVLDLTDAPQSNEASDQPNSSEAKALIALHANDTGGGLRYNEWKALKSVPDGSFSRTIKQLMYKGFVVQGRFTERYQTTPGKGAKYANEHMPRQQPTQERQPDTQDGITQYQTGITIPATHMVSVVSPPYRGDTTDTTDTGADTDPQASREPIPFRPVAFQENMTARQPVTPDAGAGWVGSRGQAGNVPSDVSGSGWQGGA